MSRKREPLQKPTESALYDAAPFPAKMPRKITDKENRDWGLDGIAAKIPEGVVVMITGTKKP